MAFKKGDKEMPAKIIFADKKGMVYLNCPSCGDVSVRPVDQYFNMPQPLHISCTCGNTYEIQIEFRKSFRKKINLEGYYSRVHPPGSFEKMTITDISMGGCRFLTENRHLLRKDDLVKLVFNLDNATRTKITKEATICSFNERSVRCKFIDTSSGLDSDLGFYLRSI
jgi:hypothetical protein